MTAAAAAAAPSVEPRPPEEVMRLARMGAFHQTRISFMRCLLRRVAAEGWRLTRPRFDLDDDGYGAAVYRVETPAGAVSLVAFAHELAPEERSDRAIAKKWDATFALALGDPSPADIARLGDNVPLQEAGRCGASEVVLSRANKSVRLFESVVDCLARGRQPSIGDIARVGYLMRTTAVYGNGKYGLSDLPRTFASGVFGRPFEAEMLAVYLIREFTFDLVGHLAARRAPGCAVGLAPDRRRMLGIGNATGLGMAPFLISHPSLIHRWIVARETAIARVFAEAAAPPAKRAAFLSLLARAIGHVAEWETGDARQSARIVALARDLAWLEGRLAGVDGGLLAGRHPWRAIARLVAAHCAEETQELLNSLMMEPHGELVDDLADAMGDPERDRLDPSMTLGDLRAGLERDFAWALGIDFDRPGAQHFFWYISAEKLEPRLGERGVEPGVERELRIGIGREAQALHRALVARAADGADAGESVAAFLLREPQWRFMVRRAQLAGRHAYGEIQDNLLAADCLAIDLLRCKHAFFGAIKFDPKSDRWIRITMYQGAPAFAELEPGNADDWAFPVFAGGAGSHP